MKIPTLENYFDAFQQHDPVLLKMFYRRRIACPHGYVTPKYFALISAAQHNLTSTPIEERLVSTNWAISNCPTYFLEANFLEAVLATEPPTAFALNSIHLPLPEMLVCLPSNVSINYFGFLVPYIGYATAQVIEHPDKKALGFHAVLIPDDGKPIGYYGRIPTHDIVDSIAGHPFVDHSDDINQELQKRWSVDKVTDATRHAVGTKLPTSEEDLIITDKAFALLCKLFLVLNSAPKHLPEELNPHRTNTNGTRTGRAKCKGGLWQPVFIGASFHPTFEPNGNGHHASPRMHWRRGHIRQQRWGKDNALVRTVWIEPVLVNAET